jgi:catechol 2,3-dioxygenase
MEIAPAAHMGLVELSVSDLDRSLAYWQDAVGLRVLSRENGTAELGDDTPLVRFVEEPGARPADGYTGLFHVALLVPDRPSLARFLAHASREGIALTGLSDHAVSDAIYLRDPDHHGIEIYADRPRERWEGQVDTQMTTAPIDVENLLGELDDPATEPFDGLPDGTKVGHVHLCVADVDDAIRFYRDGLGLDLVVRHGEAAFLSAGGYHHHIGANTWQTRGAPPAPEGTARLLRFTVVLPDEAEVERVAERIGGTEARDPSGNPLALVAAA